MKKTSKHTVSTPQPCSPYTTALVPEEAPLSPRWAFVVQFRTDTAIEARRVAGRAEHVVSGQTTHFASLEELAAFMARVLASVRSPPQPSERVERQKTVGEVLFTKTPQTKP